MSGMRFTNGGRTPARDRKRDAYVTPPCYAVRFTDTGEYFGRDRAGRDAGLTGIEHACTTTDLREAERWLWMANLPDGQVVQLEKNAKGQYDPTLSRGVGRGPRR